MTLWFNNICLYQIGKKFWSTWTFQLKKLHNCTSSKHLIKTKLLKKSMDMNCRFYWEITTFFGKHIFNIHFCIPNVHFFFVQKSTYMKISIMKLIFLVQILKMISHLAKWISNRHLPFYRIPFHIRTVHSYIILSNVSVPQIPIEISPILRDLIIVIFYYQIPHKPLKTLNLSQVNFPLNFPLCYIFP